MSEAQNTAELLEAELQAQKQKLKEQKAQEKRQKRARNKTKATAKKIERSKAREAARAAAPGRMVIVLNGRAVEARVVERPDQVVGYNAGQVRRQGAVQSAPTVYRPVPDHSQGCRDCNRQCTDGSCNGPRTDDNRAPVRSPNRSPPIEIPEVGDKIYTPRFLSVRVTRVFPSERAMREAGYDISADVWDRDWVCYGKGMVSGRFGWEQIDFAVAPKRVRNRNAAPVRNTKPNRNRAPAKNTKPKAKGTCSTKPGKSKAPVKKSAKAPAKKPVKRRFDDPQS